MAQDAPYGEDEEPKEGVTRRRSPKERGPKGAPKRDKGLKRKALPKNFFGYADALKRVPDGDFPKIGAKIGAKVGFSGDLPPDLGSLGPEFMGPPDPAAVRSLPPNPEDALDLLLRMFPGTRRSGI
jgi:hypothetical protein